MQNNRSFTALHTFEIDRFQPDSAVRLKPNFPNRVSRRFCNNGRSFSFTLDAGTGDNVQRPTGLRYLAERFESDPVRAARDFVRRNVDRVDLLRRLKFDQEKLFMLGPEVVLILGKLEPGLHLLQTV
jgi:hypothetical protein